MRSDPGEWVGGGGNYTGTGDISVTISTLSTGLLGFRLVAPANKEWRAEFAAKSGASLFPGLYDPAEGYPFSSPGYPSLSIGGNGAGCNALGRFSVEELEVSPTRGVTRASITFEAHCDGKAPGLYGVINYHASGVPDPVPAGRDIALSGPVNRVAYDAVTDTAYGVDPVNRRLAKISLTDGQIAYKAVLQTPNDLCVDTARGRLYVVNKGSTLISEHATGDLALLRQFTWAGTDSASTHTQTRFKIVCAPGKLYVVDGAAQPALFAVEGLDNADGAAPKVTDVSTKVSGVGALTPNRAGTQLLYWTQYGWSAGNLNTALKRLDATTLAVLDESTLSYTQNFQRDPLDTPILIDETRGLVFAKNKVFSASDFKTVIYTLPGAFESFGGAAENAYAIDPVCGLMASRNHIYELGRYDIVGRTLNSKADQLFFDKRGALWHVISSEMRLRAQSEL